MAEAFLAGLIGFLIGRGVQPQDATAIVEALRDYLGYEPPLGLTGYALEDIQAGKEANSAIVVRGKAYDVVALGDITKHSPVSVLGRKGDRLEVAPTIEALKVIETVNLLKTIQAIQSIDVIEHIKAIESIGFSIATNYVMNPCFEAGFTDWMAAKNCSLYPVEFHGKYMCKITWSGSAAAPDLTQWIITAPKSDNLELVFMCLNEIFTQAKVKVWIHYTDDTETVQVFSLIDALKYYRLPAAAGKYIEKIAFCNDSSVGVQGYILLDDCFLKPI